MNFRETPVESAVPRCAHYAACGGRVLQHRSREARVAAKQQALLEDIENLGRVRPRKARALLKACLLPRIVYVSRRSATLVRDAGLLVHSQGYRLQSVGLADMFPHTAYVEVMAALEKAE